MRDFVRAIVDDIGQVLLGKEDRVKLALTCLFSDGHLLIEDLPGMGKTTLAHALARVLGLRYQRVQFTSDMLPADIIGVSVYEQGRFDFHPGPVFTQVLLADEINRTTPKTQSALLEAMEERQVTVEGDTRALDEPFFVIATQNPLSQMGTFPLPESQLDRFLMRISLGYPDETAERALLRGEDPRRRLARLPERLSPGQLPEIKRAAGQVQVSDSLLDYLQRLVRHTRRSPDFACGLSPRGAMALLRAARTWAYLHGRQYVIAEDLQTLVPPVVGHRVSAAAAGAEGHEQTLMAQLLNAVDVVG